MTTQNIYTGELPLATDLDEFDEVLSKIDSFEPDPICGRSEQAVARLLGRRDQLALYNGKWRRFAGDPIEYLGRHLDGRLLLGAVHGGVSVGTTKVVAWDIDAHVAGASPTELDVKQAARAVAQVVTQLGAPMPLFVSSKSGVGIHVYLLLEADVGTREAHAFGTFVKSKVRRREVDRVYPTPSSTGLVLALPLCARRGGRPEWLGVDGSRVLDPERLAPINEADEPERILGWPSVALDQWRTAMGGIPVPELPKAAGHEPTNERKKQPERGDELVVLSKKCAFIQRVADHATAISYDEWFSLATILRPFDHGRRFFHRLSALDSARYDAEKVDATFDSVKAKPRHCTNLGWSCPNLPSCSALGVRSPAGLPYKLRGRRAA